MKLWLLARHMGWSVVVVIALTSAVISTPSLAQQQNTQLKLGFLMPLTGGSGQLGQMMIQGSRLAVEEINESGGINGHELVLVPEDSQARARQGVDGLRKLVDIDRAETVITGWTAVVVAVAPVAERREVFLLSGSTASPAVRGVSPFFQSTWMFDDETVRLILPYAKESLDVERLALFTVQTDLGVGLSESIRQKWSTLGGNLVREESHQQDETNFRPSLIRMLGSRPDAIYITSSNGEQSAQIIRQARELGYEGLFLSYGAIEDPEVLELGSRAEDTYYSSPAFDPSSDRELTAAFVRKFEAEHGRRPNVHQANHYDLVYMYKTAAKALLDEGKPVTGVNVRDYFRDNVPTYEGSAGDYTFNYEDGSVLRSTVVKTIRGNEFVTVDVLE